MKNIWFNDKQDILNPVVNNKNLVRQWILQFFVEQNLVLS